MALDVNTHRPRCAAIAAKLTYCDHAEEYSCRAWEYDSDGSCKEIHTAEPIQSTGWTDQRLHDAVDYFAAAIRIPAELWIIDDLDHSATLKLDFGRTYEITEQLEMVWSFERVAAADPFGDSIEPNEFHCRAPSRRTAAAMLAAQLQNEIGVPVDVKHAGGRSDRYYARPLETYADCPCGERLKFGLTLCPLSQKLGYDVLQTCPECGRQAAHLNSRTGEIYSWMTPAAIDNARDIMEQMEADADANAFGRDSGW